MRTEELHFFNTFLSTFSKLVHYLITTIILNKPSCTSINFYVYGVVILFLAVADLVVVVKEVVGVEETEEEEAGEVVEKVIKRRQRTKTRKTEIKLKPSQRQRRVSNSH